MLVVALGKQVEQHAQSLDRRGGDVQFRVEIPGVVAVEVQLQSFDDHVGGDSFPLALDGLLAEREQRAPGEVGLFGQPVR